MSKAPQTWRLSCQEAVTWTRSNKVFLTEIGDVTISIENLSVAVICLLEGAAALSGPYNESGFWTVRDHGNERALESGEAAAAQSEVVRLRPNRNWYCLRVRMLPGSLLRSVVSEEWSMWT